MKSKFKNFLETFIPPWQNSGIGRHPWSDIAPQMIPISSILPVHGRNQRPAKPIDPTKPYQPLVINSKNELQDGYHRYFDLIDNNYQGDVPVVTINI